MNELVTIQFSGGVSDHIPSLCRAEIKKSKVLAVCTLEPEVNFLMLFFGENELRGLGRDPLVQFVCGSAVRISCRHRWKTDLRLV